MARDAISLSAASRNLLGVFARYWQPGEAKTRLARRIGEEPAAELHRQFVSCTLERFCHVAGQRLLAVTPAEAMRRVVRECPAAQSWQIVAQGKGDLGERMRRFFQQSRAAAKRVVLIGSDSPDLPPSIIGEAFAALLDAPVVLGPADDGGYYLIGIASRLPAEELPILFDEMPWSSPTLLTETCRRLERRGIGSRLLPLWQDVDEWDDLLALRQRLESEPIASDEPLSALQQAVERAIAVNQRK